MILNAREIRLIDYALCFLSANLTDEETASLMASNEEGHEIEANCEAALQTELHELAQKVQTTEILT